jgi:hypothetical protein
MITISVLKREAKQKIDLLSDDKLKVAFDFLNYLEEREEWEATEELLQIPNLLEEYRRAKAEIKAGQTVKWSEIRIDV